MFPNGVSAYVDLMQDLIPEMKDGTIRTSIDTGCGVSFLNLTNIRGYFLQLFRLCSVFKGCKLGRRLVGPWYPHGVTSSKR